MTERTLKVSMTLDMAWGIYSYVEDQLRQEPDAKTEQSLKEMRQKAIVWTTQFNLMNKATKLYEDDRIALFEHPIKGDEAPMMCYWKDREFFDEDTGFYDVADVEEIVESYRSAFKDSFS